MRSAKTRDRHAWGGLAPRAEKILKPCWPFDVGFSGEFSAYQTTMLAVSFVCDQIVERDDVFFEGRSGFGGPLLSCADHALKRDAGYAGCNSSERIRDRKAASSWCGRLIHESCRSAGQQPQISRRAGYRRTHNAAIDAQDWAAPPRHYAEPVALLNVRETSSL